MSATSYSGGEGADQSWHYCPSFAGWDFQQPDTLLMSHTHKHALFPVDGPLPPDDLWEISWTLSIYSYYRSWSSTAGICSCFSNFLYFFI